MLVAFSSRLSPFHKTLFRAMLQGAMAEKHEDTGLLIEGVLGQLLVANIGLDQEKILGFLSNQVGELAKAMSDVCHWWQSQVEADKKAKEAAAAALAAATTKEGTPTAEPAPAPAIAEPEVEDTRGAAKLMFADRRYIKLFHCRKFYDTIENKMVDLKVVPLEVISYSVSRIYVNICKQRAESEKHATEITKSSIPGAAQK